MKSFKSKFSKQLDQFSFFDNNYSSGLIAALHILKYPKYPWTRSGVMQDSKLMSETKIKIHFGWNDGFYLHIISILDYSIYVLVGGNGTPLQYSCLENPMDRGGWWAPVHGVAKSWIWLKQLSTARIYRWKFKTLGKLAFEIDNFKTWIFKWEST